MVVLLVLPSIVSALCQRIWEGKECPTNTVISHKICVCNHRQVSFKQKYYYYTPFPYELYSTFKP